LYNGINEHIHRLLFMFDVETLCQEKIVNVRDISFVNEMCKGIVYVIHVLFVLELLLINSIVSLS